MRRGDRFEQFLLACEADARGRLGLEQRAYPQAQRLRNALDAARKANVAALAKQFHKEALGLAIKQARISAIAHWLETAA